MSNNKTDELTRISEMFSAMSNPNRLKLLLRLLECCGREGSCSTDQGMGACVGELADGLNLSKSTVSHHLKELRRTGLITMEREGRNVRCTINATALGELSSVLDRGRLSSTPTVERPPKRRAPKVKTTTRKART